LKCFSELDTWPVFDESYIVDRGVSEGETYVESIAPGALVGAVMVAGDTPAMQVAEDLWNEDFSERRVLKILRYTPK
jgi:hypothetical protein